MNTPTPNIKIKASKNTSIYDLDLIKLQQARNIPSLRDSTHKYLDIPSLLLALCLLSYLYKKTVNPFIEGFGSPQQRIHVLLVRFNVSPVPATHIEAYYCFLELRSVTRIKH